MPRIFERSGFSWLPILASLGALALTGCLSDIQTIGREPAMTPVGAGIGANMPYLATAEFPPPQPVFHQSLWDNNRADLFRDPRATRIGDVLTVTIAINDNAKLNNESDRSGEAAVTNTTDLGLKTTNDKASATLAGDTTSNSSYQGKGAVNRSEQIALSIAAIVTQVLPNGNLVVSGSQEVRVNYELRELQIGGIVRPRDISKDNTIAYEKIAEARISYGGRGRQSEVQQPGWGHQLYDIIKPF